MHDEFESAVTGRAASSGLSPLGWVLTVVGVVALAGVLGAGFIGYRVVKEVREKVADVRRELGVSPNIAAARVAARLASADDLVSMDPERGLAFLSDFDGADRPAELLKALSAPLPTRDGPARPDAPDAPPASPSGDGASFRIGSEDGDVSFRLERTNDGGWLTFDSPEGRVRLEFAGGEENGRLRIVTDEAQIEAGFGDDAEPAPSWVRRLGEVPGRAKPVLSLISDRGRLGAVAWEADEESSVLLAAYQATLEAEGYEVKAEHRMRSADQEHGSLWARHGGDARMVFVVAHRDERGRTGVLMGYGEER